MFALCGFLLAGCLGGSLGGCKKGEPSAGETPTELPKLSDEPAAAAGATKAPVQGAKLDALKPEARVRFEALTDQLPSPCGKAHSLRTSRNTDAACLRAPFAVDYVSSLLEDGASDEELKELYMARYPAERKKIDFKVGPTVPHTGPDDARVVFVEFFDYGCPACAQFAPVLAEVQAGSPRDVAIYYKQYPMPAHPDSAGAAQAALAAGKQGKYKEMHELLFKDQDAHKKADLDRLAKQIGLDMARFEKDYAAAAATVAADRAEGSAAGVQGTPTIFVNGVLLNSPPVAKYIKMWVDEELALNR